MPRVIVLGWGDGCKAPRGAFFLAGCGKPQEGDQRAGYGMLAGARRDPPGGLLPACGRPQGFAVTI